jgi:hypothetical protein
LHSLKQVGKIWHRKLFEVGQRIGFDILPRHFYSGIPDIRMLLYKTHWRGPLDMHGVAGAEIAGQISYIEGICPPPLRNELATLDVHAAAVEENGQGGGYGVIEAAVLHAFIRYHRPRRVVQVGCGVSTSVIARAAIIAAYRSEIVCIEPFPSSYLVRAHQNGQIQLHQQAAEECPREIMTNLAAGDLLFVDSTHAVKPGSEVNRIILDVLPRLAPGVFIHFHDIYFPYDYQRGLITDELFFSTESTLLHAFLIGNTRCRILLSLSLLHYAAPHSLRNVIPHYDPQRNLDGLCAPGGSHFPSATYLLMTDHHESKT